MSTEPVEDFEYEIEKGSDSDYEYWVDSFLRRGKDEVENTWNRELLLLLAEKFPRGGFFDEEDLNQLTGERGSIGYLKISLRAIDLTPLPGGWRAIEKDETQEKPYTFDGRVAAAVLRLRAFWPKTTYFMANKIVLTKTKVSGFPPSERHPGCCDSYFVRFPVPPLPANTPEDESNCNSERIPEHVRKQVWRRDQGRCAYPGCKSRVKLCFDHIVPRSKGGSNTARNIELLCEKHNLEKAATTGKVPENGSSRDFYKVLGFEEDEE